MDHPTPQPVQYYQEDEIDLLELWGALAAEKWTIFLITSVATVGALIVAFLMPDVYRGEALLAPAESRQSGSPLSSQLGGAAALIGIDVGTDSNNEINTAIAILQSREFIRRFITEHNILVPLFAGTWDEGTGESGINSGVYDVEQQVWLREEGEPTFLEAYRVFDEAQNVQQDTNTGLITLSFDWHDPVLASEWVNQMAADVNRDIKARDVEEANNAIAFLRQQLQGTQLVEMQRVFYDLIESQTRIIMLADVRDEYVFRLIDPAIVPDRAVSPRRVLIVVISAMAGVMLAILFVLLRRASRGRIESGSES